MTQQAALTGGRKIAYARGLWVQVYKGRTEVAHSGATAGYRAWLARLPAQGLSIALLCNRGDANPVELGHAIAGTIAPQPPEIPPTGSGGREPARLVGTYVDERTGGVLRIAVQDGALRVRGGGILAPVAPGHYQVGGSDFTFRQDGGVERRGADGELFTYRRVEPVTPTGADLAPIAGAYASSEAGAIVLASVRDGRLWLAPADRPSNLSMAEPLERDAFTANGNLVRVQRGPDGKVTALRFTGGRVYSLDFRRIEAP
jgi:hypothetical protein